MWIVQSSISSITQSLSARREKELVVVEIKHILEYAVEQLSTVFATIFSEEIGYCQLPNGFLVYHLLSGKLIDFVWVHLM